MAGGEQFLYTYAEDGDPWITDIDDPRADILALPGLIEWCQADPTRITLNADRATAIAGLKGVGSFVQATDSARPTVTNGDNGIDGLPALSFVRTSPPDRMQLSGVDINVHQSFTNVMIINADDMTITPQAFAGKSVDSSNRCLLNATIGESALTFVYGGATTVKVPIESGKSYLVFQVYDRDDATIALRVNGVTYPLATGATEDAGGNAATWVVGSSTTAGNSPSTYKTTELGLSYQRNLLKTPADVARIEDYMRVVQPSIFGEE